MSTPAARAMGDAGGGGTQPAPGGGGAPPPGGGGGGAPPAPGGGGQKPFWDALVPANKPEYADDRAWLANKGFADPIAWLKATRTLETEAATLRSTKGYPASFKQDGSIDPGDENANRAWRQFAGVPEKPDGYNIPMPKDSPFPQLKDGMAHVMHEAGVPPAMATRLAIGFNETMAKLEQAYRSHEDAESERGVAVLRDEWGANFGEKAAVADRGWRFLQAQFARLNPGKDGKGEQLSDTQKRVLEASLGTPTFMKIMNAIGAGNRESSFAGDPNLQREGFQGGETELDQQIDALYKARVENKISDIEWRGTAERPGKEAEYIKLLEQKAARAQAAQMSFGR